MTLADELERLGNATESGDWYADSLGYIPSAGVTDVHSGDRRVAEFMPKADAALIVALRNNLPVIIAALRALEWQPNTQDGRDGSEFLVWRKGYRPWVGRREDYGVTHYRPLPTPPAHDKGEK